VLSFFNLEREIGCPRIMVFCFNRAGGLFQRELLSPRPICSFVDEISPRRRAGGGLATRKESEQKKIASVPVSLRMIIGVALASCNFTCAVEYAGVQAAATDNGGMASGRMTFCFDGSGTTSGAYDPRRRSADLVH
jgi:hypothetical protein